MTEAEALGYFADGLMAVMAREKRTTSEKYVDVQAGAAIKHLLNGGVAEMPHSPLESDQRYERRFMSLMEARFGERLRVQKGMAVSLIWID